VGASAIRRSLRGTYANNATCAVSATGDGEFFHHGHGRARRLGVDGISAAKTVEEASVAVIDKIAKLGGPAA